MPFDGIVTKCVVDELNRFLAGGRINKITQPEKDEIIFHIRANGENWRLLMCVNPSFPRIHLTESQRENPKEPPMFCMLLRKHISGSRIESFIFNDFERMITMQVISTDELGDSATKSVIIEIMGKHSNIILVNHNNTIIDSIKHIDSDISRLREVMPARPYITPPSQDKTSPYLINMKQLNMDNKDTATPVNKFLLQKIKGFSPVLCREICHKSQIDSDVSVYRLDNEAIKRLDLTYNSLLSDIKDMNYSPCLIKDKSQNKMIDFHCFTLLQYESVEEYTNISDAIDTFYLEKNNAERMRNRCSDLIKLINKKYKNL